MEEQGWSNWVTLLPAQAARVSQEAGKTGAAVAVSQNGNVITIDNGRTRFKIGAGGQDLPTEE